MNDRSDLNSGVTDSPVDSPADSATNSPSFAPLQPGDSDCFAANSSQINSQVDIGKLGFNNDLQIANSGADAHTAPDVVALNDNGRQMALNDDGSYQYVAQAGDSYWRVASDVLSQREGEKASDKEVLAYVDTLAKYNEKADPNKLAIGEAIYIPPAIADGSTDAAPADATDTSPTSATTPNANTDAPTDKPIDQANNPTASQMTGDASAPRQPASATTDTDASPTPTALETVPTNSDTIAANDNSAAAPATAAADSQVAANAGVTANDPRVKSHDNDFSPIAPPGQGEADYGTSVTSAVGTLQDRVAEAPVALADGGSEDKYTGTINNGWLNGWGATSFTGSEKIDKDGYLYHRDIEYSTGMPINVINASGEEIPMTNITSVTTDRQADGQYLTKMTDGEGAVYTSEANASGQTITLVTPW